MELSKEPLVGLKAAAVRVYMSRVTTGQRSDVGGTARNRQPSDSDVVHHIRLRQRQIAAITCIGLGILAGHVQHPGMVEGGETVGGSSSGGELSTGGARPR